MKKSKDAGGLQEEVIVIPDEEIKNQQSISGLDNKLNCDTAVADRRNGSTSNNSHYTDREDDESDIIVLREGKTSPSRITTKDEDCSSESKRRSSTRLRGKRPKLVDITTSEEDEHQESEDDYFEERVSKARSVKKRSQTPKKSPKTESKDEQVSEGKTKSKRTPNENKAKKQADSSSKISKEFTSGAFVVLKTDFHASRTPAIWRIDGKALLQKYVHFDEGGHTLYKNTSTYSGWVANNKDQYYPASVEIKSQNRKETVVKFLREAIIADDSD